MQKSKIAYSPNGYDTFRFEEHGKGKKNQKKNLRVMIPFFFFALGAPLGGMGERERGLLQNRAKKTPKNNLSILISLL